MGESMKRRKNNLSVKSKINEVQEDGVMVKKETSAELKAENASVVNVTNLWAVKVTGENLMNVFNGSCDICVAPNHQSHECFIDHVLENVLTR